VGVPLPIDKNSSYREETSAAAFEHTQINEILERRNREMYEQLEPVFAGRRPVNPTLAPEALAALYERFVDHPMHPPSERTAASVLDNAREHHLLREVFKAYGLDPGENLLDRLGLKEMEKLFEEEDLRRNTHGRER
jgi:hypothetical protein